MKRILVGVDGSPESLEAVKWTADLAGAVGAEVIVASVYGMFPSMVMPGAGYYITDEALATWRKQLQEDLDGDWSKALREAGVRVVTKVEEGHAADVLLGLAEANQVDLIVVGSRGHGAVAEMLLGSVSHNLVLRAPCPVVVLPPHHTNLSSEKSAAPSAMAGAVV